VLRAGFARTIYAARQYVGHGHVEVNGRKVNIPSYQVSTGDVICVRERSRSLACFREALERAVPPPYLDVDRDNLRATLLALPQQPELIPVTCEIQRVIEYYSK